MAMTIQANISNGHQKKYLQLNPS